MPIFHTLKINWYWYWFIGFTYKITAIYFLCLWNLSEIGLYKCSLFYKHGFYFLKCRSNLALHSFSTQKQTSARCVGAFLHLALWRLEQEIVWVLGELLVCWYSVPTDKQTVTYNVHLGGGVLAVSALDMTPQRDSYTADNFSFPFL